MSYRGEPGARAHDHNANRYLPGTDFHPSQRTLPRVAEDGLPGANRGRIPKSRRGFSSLLSEETPPESAEEKDTGVPVSTGRIPKSRRGFSTSSSGRRIASGLGVLVVIVLGLVDSNLAEFVRTRGKLTRLERLIVVGMCQSRCNAQYGYQERQVQVDMFDHYMPYLCHPDNHFNCSECSKACLSNRFDPVDCKQHCRSDSCDESCQFLHSAYVKEIQNPGYPSVPAWGLPPASQSLTLTKPQAVCTYTNLSSLSNDTSPKSLIRVSWNVRDVTNRSTSAPLTFVIAIQNCSSYGTGGCATLNAWSFYKKTTNFSVIPVYDLQPNTTYVVKVVAVHWSGYIPGSAVSDPITTPPARERLGTPVELSFGKQYVRAGTLSVIVSWKAPPESGGCYFRLYCMPPKGSYKMYEIMYWGQLKYELKQLKFNSSYLIQVYNLDYEFTRHSRPANITLRTLESCLKATSYDYNNCPPEKPDNFRITSSLPYKILVNDTEQRRCDVTATWDPPKYTRHRNVISEYTLIFRKEPDMHHADAIPAHKGNFELPPTTTNFTIPECHWDGIYVMTVWATSPGGAGEESTANITLGNGYADYYDSAQPERPASLRVAVADKAVLYATIATVLLGVVAVGVCVMYRLRMGSTKSILIGDSLHREEINPIYECAVSKEEEELLVPDEYDIDPDALEFQESIGEGAFGKVMKALLDLRLAPIGGRSSGKQVVAVKMLKEYATPDERRNLRLEMDAMKQLGQHQNIVSLIACVTSSQNPYLIMHYCPLGDLRTFLRNCRTKVSKKTSHSGDTVSASGRRAQLNSGDSGISYASKTSLQHKAHRECATSLVFADDVCGAVGGVPAARESTSTENSDTSSALFVDGDQEVLSQTKLLSFARQIAMGMEYLAERKFIHRDLAARNILLYNHRQLKISDFGLARDVYETCMYQPTSARKLPYKWMSIESIFDQVFTIKSDVWSFGIVLWEIVTLGGCPYPGILNKDLFQWLKEGYRMEKPENCSLELYKMMLCCWHPRPEDRPTFTELRNTLELSLEKAQSYIDLSVTVSEDYYKQDSECSNNNSAPCNTPQLNRSDPDAALSDSSNTAAAAAAATSNRLIRTAADVHVCHLFHNNSADKNLTLGLAQSVTLAGPTSDPENSPQPSPPSRTAAALGGSEKGDYFSAGILRKGSNHSSGSSKSDGEAGSKRKRGSGKKGGKAAENAAVSGRVSLEGLDEEETTNGAEQGAGQAEEGRDDCVRNGVVDKGGHSSAASHLPTTATSPRSASGSSSTELSCDCDSPDDLSETSMSSSMSGSQAAKVQHAPSLTYGILSLFRAGKGAGKSRKGLDQHKRHSRSLMDIDRLEMDMGTQLTSPSCAYDQRTDAWACAL